MLHWSCSFSVIFMQFLVLQICIVSTARQRSKGKREEIIFCRTRDRMFVIMLYEIYSFTSLNVFSVTALVFCCTLLYFITWDFCTPYCLPIHCSCCYPNLNCFVNSGRKSVLVHSWTQIQKTSFRKSQGLAWYKG